MLVMVAGMTMAFSPLSQASSDVLQLQTRWSLLQFSINGNYLEEVAINDDQGALSMSPRRVSLVTRGDRESLSRHLSISGIEWSTETLHASVDDGSLVFSVLSMDGRIELKKRLVQISGQPRFQLDLEFINRSPTTLSLDDDVALQLGPGLGEYPKEDYGFANTLYSYVEPVFMSDKNELKRLPFDEDHADRVVNVDFPVWVGLQSRYFALLVSPAHGQSLGQVRLNNESDISHVSHRYLPKVKINLELDSIAPEDSAVRNYSIYVGPKSIATLSGDGYDFSALLFSRLWEWMRALSFALLWLLGVIYEHVHSWGLAILVLAICVRALIYPLARQSLKSQQLFLATQTSMQPELAEIKRKYKGGEQSERILQLYEQYGVSPLAGLKPLLLVVLQLPIFVALFNVLGQVFEFRDASFLWIDTLAEPDRLFPLGFEIPLLGDYFNILPVLMAISTFLMIGMSSGRTSDKKDGKQQTWILVLMGFVFFVLFYPFPSGMVLYWTMANVLHLIQHWFVAFTSKVEV